MERGTRDLGAFARGWVESREAKADANAAQMRKFYVWMDRRGYARLTIRNYVRRITAMNAWLDEHRALPLPATSWSDLRSYGNTLPNTYASRQGQRGAIVNFWKFLGKRNESPAWAIESPKRPDYQCRAIEPEEIERLLATARAMGTLEYVACCAMYYQGLRREETSRLRWEDVSGGQLHGVGKGRQEFSLPLHPKFVEALSALEVRGPWILYGRWPGTHVSPNTVWMFVRLASERAGLGRVTPHQLRHSSIATVNDATELRTAMTWARHKDPKVTAVYTRTKVRKLREGMDAL